MASAVLVTLLAGVGHAADDVSWFEPSPEQMIARQLAENMPAPVDPGLAFLSWPGSGDTTGTVAASILTRTVDKAASHDDLAQLKAVVEMIERGNLGTVEDSLSAISHADARLAAEWVLVRSGAPRVSFQRIVQFMEDHGDWVPLPPLQRRAEEAMLSQRVPAPRVLAFFAANPPLGAAGRAAHALALKQAERHGEADSLVKRIWREDHLGRDLEGLMLNAFRDVLTARDHRNRMEMYLFKENAEAATRSAQRAGPDHVRLVQARLAVARKSSGAAGALAAVPAGLRNDTSFVFAEAQHHRRSERADVAARLIAPLPREIDLLIDGDEWWVERRLIARQLLDKGLFAEAYTVAARHSAQKPSSIIEAEWHAGWIALRFLSDSAKAATHFAEAAKHAETPISVARAAYWQGRAAEAAGDDVTARAFYEIAAARPVAFYGQIARTRLGLADMPLRAAPAAHVRPQGHRALTLLELLDAAGRPGTVRSLALELGRHLTDVAHLEHVAAIADRIGEPRLLVSLGKTALQRGIPLDATAFPTHGMPPFDSAVERAIAFAIARQESAFDPKAVSHAGARGLMQLMLPTARETARRIKIAFDAGRLTSDPAYNAKLGAAHLADLITEWRGSYVLTFAAYNAGSGNVRDWINTFGDPRNPDVDPIDWIERIPFTETRNYVQRVMENLQVYRQRLGAELPLLIAHDLRRGVRSAPTQAASLAGTSTPSMALPNE